MTQTYSLRPREKIASRSATALSDHELLQVIIGAGTKQASVSRIARSILKVLRRNKGTLLYDELRQIPGLGNAYTTRILAAFELARRWGNTDRPIDPPVSLSDELQKQRPATNDLLACDFYDGAGGFIERQIIALHSSIDLSVPTRQILSKTLYIQASTVAVGISGERNERMLYMSDIVYCRTIASVLKAIGVGVRKFSIITNEGTKELL